MKKYLSASAFLLAAALSFTALLLPPPGEIDNSVLVLVAQLLVLCATLLGVKIKDPRSQE